VYETGLLLLLLFARIYYIALLLLFPLSFVLGVGAPSFTLVGFMIKAARRGLLSFSLFVVASAACVLRDGLAACLRMCHVALLVLLLPLSLSLLLFVFLGRFARRRFPSVASGSKLLDVAHCSLLHQLFLLCFGFALALALIVIAK
tara:strand:- start:60 stop:497 length:438 start_codon:yes stop_codon:yes gene_type:complete